MFMTDDVLFLVVNFRCFFRTSLQQLKLIKISKEKQKVDGKISENCSELPDGPASQIQTKEDALAKGKYLIDAYSLRRQGEA